MKEEINIDRPDGIHHIYLTITVYQDRGEWKWLLCDDFGQVGVKGCDPKETRYEAMEAAGRYIGGCSDERIEYTV